VFEVDSGWVPTHHEKMRRLLEKQQPRQGRMKVARQALPGKVRFADESLNGPAAKGRPRHTNQNDKGTCFIVGKK